MAATLFTKLNLLAVPENQTILLTARTKRGTCIWRVKPGMTSQRPNTIPEEITKLLEGLELSPVAQLMAQPRRVKSGVTARAKAHTVGGTAATRVPGRFPRSQQETFKERPWRHIYPRRMIAQLRLLAGDKGQVLGQ